ncbi:hypothetical protein AB4Z40_19725 [Bosea sp. 2YAB26]|uniref:hypothetical protein n=1 Tax=Bosea sp. 2YAB26 TaxID=3237478 RepID=UPI003F939B85
MMALVLVGIAPGETTAPGDADPSTGGRKPRRINPLVGKARGSPLVDIATHGRILQE